MSGPDESAVCRRCGDRLEGEARLLEGLPICRRCSERFGPLTLRGGFVTPKALISLAIILGAFLLTAALTQALFPVRPIEDKVFLTVAFGCLVFLYLAPRVRARELQIWRAAIAERLGLPASLVVDDPRFTLAYESQEPRAFFLDDLHGELALLFADRSGVALIRRDGSVLVIPRHELLTASLDAPYGPTGAARLGLISRSGARLSLSLFEPMRAEERQARIAEVLERLRRSPG